MNSVDNNNNNEFHKLLEGEIENITWGRTAILAVDVGTTNLKTNLYDQNLKLLNSNSIKLNVLQSNEGYFELEPDDLIQSIKDSVKNTLKDYKDSYRIKCFGVSVQRNSFLLFNKKTNDVYTNFILWNDMRSPNHCNSLNNSFILNLAKKSASFATYFIRNEFLNAVSNLKIEMRQVTPKLVDVLTTLEDKLEKSEFENVLYATIETYVIWQLTKEKTFATEYSCACASGLFDIFRQKDWSSFLLYLFSIPRRILPQAYDTCHLFGNIKKDFIDLDYEIPITAIIGDAQSCLIAECGFEKGDCVLTIGTGAFFSVNIGDKPICSHHGLYPLVAYKNLNDQIYILHYAISSAGIAIDWAKSIGLFDSYDELEELLKSTENSNRVYFLPSFGSVEINNSNKANITSGFIGLKLNTNKCHMIRAIFDSIAFSIKIKMDLMLKDLQYNKISVNSIRISGGVSRNNFLCQYLANLLQSNIERSNSSFTSSSTGAAFLAGLGSKTFENLKDMYKYREVTDIFKPQFTHEAEQYLLYDYNLSEWKKTLDQLSKL